jgi:hypothetical protein
MGPIVVPHGQSFRTMNSCGAGIAAQSRLYRSGACAGRTGFIIVAARAAEREGFANACDGCSALRRPARCSSAHKAAQCRRLAKVRQQSGAGPPGGAAAHCSLGHSSGRTVALSTPVAPGGSGSMGARRAPRRAGPPHLDRHFGLARELADDEARHRVRRVPVRRHWAGCGPPRPAPDRADRQLARKTAGAEDSWRGRPVDRYNAPLPTAAGRVMKAPREVMRRAAGRKRPDAKAAALRAGWLRVRAAGCRSS